MYVFLILFPGGHQNHRQDPTQPIQPGKDLQRSADYEAAQPPPHHQTLPGTLLCVALCRMLFDPCFLLWRSPPGQHAGNRSGVFKPLSKKIKCDGVQNKRNHTQLSKSRHCGAEHLYPLHCQYLYMSDFGSIFVCLFVFALQLCFVLSN